MTFMLNKPRSFISQTSTKLRRGQRLAVQLLEPRNMDPKCRYRGKAPRFLNKLACAGRLDADSSGLLLFTQDGNVARNIIGADSEVEKEYLVRLADSVSAPEAREGIARQLRHGMVLDGVVLKEAEVDWVHHDTLRFVLHEGRCVRRTCNSLLTLSCKVLQGAVFITCVTTDFLHCMCWFTRNRQIRRMCASLDLDIVRLHRTRIGEYELEFTCLVPATLTWTALDTA